MKQVGYKSIIYGSLFLQHKNDLHFGGVSIYYKLQYFSFRNVKLVYLVDKPILEMVGSLAITFFFANLGL